MLIIKITASSDLCISLKVDGLVGFAGLSQSAGKQ